MADDTDDRPDEPKRSKPPKRRFKERDEKDDDEDGDRPRKKRRDGDGADDDQPTTRRRRADDGGPRVKAEDGPPVLMLLSLIGSAVALLAACVGCGWWSWVWLVGGGDFGSGNEFEVVSAGRQVPFGPFDSPTVTWEVKALRETSTKDGQYYVVMKSGSQEVVKPLTAPGKGQRVSGAGAELGLKGSSGPMDVWVEKRRTQVSTDGKKVSNVVRVQ